ATIAWGDNTTDTGTVVSDGGGSYHVTAPAHTYAEEGSFTLTVTVTHDLLPPVSGTATVSVADQQITGLVAANLPATGLEGAALGAITAIATFTDPGGAEAVGDYAATVTWGDGTTPAGVRVEPGGTG